MVYIGFFRLQLLQILQNDTSTHLAAQEGNFTESDIVEFLNTDVIEFHRPTALYILYEQTKRVVGTKLMRITYTFCFLSTVTCIYVLNKIFQIEETLKHITIAY